MFWLLKLLNQVKYHKLLYKPLYSSEAQICFEFGQSLAKQALFRLLTGRDFCLNFFVRFAIEVFWLINCRRILLEGLYGVVMREFLAVESMLFADTALHEVGIYSLGVKHVLFNSLNELLADLKSKSLSVSDELLTWSNLLLIAEVSFTSCYGSFQVKWSIFL